jgi:drug/metabolite transporter (DMT)-like permease
MTAAILCFSGQDVALKWLSADYGIAQNLFFGRVLAVPFALYLARRSGSLAQLRTRRPLAHLLRAGCTVSDMTMFVASISLMPLADTVTIGFAAPLIMTILSVLLLKERVGPRRWAAVVVGFIGVVIVMQPSGAGYGPPSLLALGSAGAFAAVLILTRGLTATESVPCLMFWNSTAVAATMALAMLPDWRTPTGSDIGLFALNAATGAVGQMLITEAFRLGEASMLAPIQYTSLLWAVWLGFLVFGNAPTVTLLFGAGIIIASTLYIVEREARLARQHVSGQA